MTCYNDACVNYGIGYSFNCSSMMADEVFVCSIRIESLESKLKVAREAVKRISPLKLAVLFHETYERLAPSFGYETKDETKVFNASSNNGKLMIEVCREMQDYWISQQKGGD